jgi:hypothetical protein
MPQRHKAVLAMLIALCPQAAQAQQVARTYVSGAGNDGNPCTPQHPCVTFQTALARTAPGGEIFVVNSANYGPVTIDKAVTITSGDGVVGGILAPGGVGIQIAAGAADVVNLRGLDIDGANSGSVGVQFRSGGTLNIQNTTVRGFASIGVNVVPSTPATFVVSDTQAINNGVTGIQVAPTGGGISGVLNRVTATGNGAVSAGAGVYVFGGFSTGPVNVSITGSVLGNNNFYGLGATAAAVNVNNTSIANNGAGIRADAGAMVLSGGANISGNGTGVIAAGGGILASFGTNTLAGNTTDGAWTKLLSTSYNYLVDDKGNYLLDNSGQRLLAM